MSVSMLEAERIKQVLQILIPSKIFSEEQENL